ncbi:adenylyl cyclase-associated protein [Anaeramoeba flamelloides]|uniref:Adenylyl cyclase-associated protein n=1 Tax=Anaeramoeba flamelloides TaxID=1746091 RepID=A0ABQ8X7I2_9EUKA|nr:adenylyl cyclase-associated protein [Anaeramoeba flamelloides]
MIHTNYRRIFVEGFKKGERVIDTEKPRNSVQVSKCSNFKLTINEKFSNLLILSCSDCTIELSNLIAGCEMVNCKNLIIKITGYSPNVVVDLCEGVLIQISNKCENIQIYTSKTSNICVQKYEQSSLKLYIPVRFMSKISKENKLINTPCDIARGVGQDLLDLYTSQEITDMEVSSMDKTFKVHSDILQIRLGKIDEQTLLFLERFHSSNVDSFLKWVYSGLVTNINHITEILNQIGFSEEQIKEKTGNEGLIKDLKRDWVNSEFKNFTLKLGNEEIKCHKGILIARSKLYFNMFLSINDQPTEISDYSGRNKKSIKILLEYFYTDLITQDGDWNFDEVYDDLYDASDFFQLSINSNFEYQLELLKEEHEKKSKKK